MGPRENGNRKVWVAEWVKGGAGVNTRRYREERRGFHLLSFLRGVTTSEKSEKFIVSFTRVLF